MSYTVKNRIETQLAELDLLMSMFPNKGELEFDDASELADLRAAVMDSDSAATHFGSVGFTLHLNIMQHKVQVSCRLLSSYPESSPVVCIRSAGLNSTQQHEFNSALQKFVCNRTSDSLACGALNETIQWISDNFDHFIVDQTHSCLSGGLSETSTAQVKYASKQQEDFSRLWIYSHHIYNREKRRTIIDTARDLYLTGFSAPGKPGIVCVEGCRSNADSFWQQIRSLPWQKITLVHREDYVSSSHAENLRRFEKFEEKCFVNAHQASGHGTHLDRGQLLQFLQHCGCKDVFRFYFGIDGKQDPSQ